MRSRDVARKVRARSIGYIIRRTQRSGAKKVEFGILSEVCGSKALDAASAILARGNYMTNLLEH
jgi:hypothetical protein